jgi:hypothetical protein
MLPLIVLWLVVSACGDRRPSTPRQAATASSFCVTARAERRSYPVASVSVGGVATEVAVHAIDLPSRPSCHPVPLGASVDISVCAEHDIEVFGPAASPGA